VPATPAGVRQALQAFEEFGFTRRITPDVGWRVQLALDEILSNIVGHGTPSAPAIEMTFSCDAGTISVEIVDATGPFNPLRAPAPDTVSPLQEREPGGLGLTLVRRLMDETLYERRDDRNHFVMRCGPHADQ